MDFLICETHTFKPIYVVELDGRPHTHAAAQRRDALRDALLQGAGVPVQRYTSATVPLNTLVADYHRVLGIPTADSADNEKSPEPTRTNTSPPNDRRRLAWDAAEYGRALAAVRHELAQERARPAPRRGVVERLSLELTHPHAVRVAPVHSPTRMRPMRNDLKQPIERHVGHDAEG